MSLVDQVLKTTLETLDNELKKEPLSPAKVTALAEVIRALSGINPLSQL